MKKGSALLVVLGMLSFMVISAVAFSAFMRYSRLPSSFLRQTSASRLLAKAALAHAIDEIDAAIGNMPHPGLWNKPGDLVAEANKYYYPRRNGTKFNRNLWVDRVYIGNRGDDDNQLRDHLADPFPVVTSNGEDDDDINAGTVSTLTLEGLAYIPPPLVAAARYYSRRSNAAKWQTLAFDAGRYAFCAIDVSDYFDVNALSANVGRNSSSAGRLSLAYLFETPEKTPGDTSAHTDYAKNPGDWETFMENFRSQSSAAAGTKGQQKSVDSSKVPLVSVADLNLAMYAKGFQDYTPFSRYVDQDLPSFYSGFDQYGIKGDVDLRTLTLVTDGWYPSSASSADADVRDLDDARNQPFPANMSGPAGAAALGDVMAASGATGSGTGLSVADRIRHRISGMGMALLKDYIDEDSVPTSLSIPQVERTPMVAAFEQSFNGSSIKVVKNEPTVSTTPGDTSCIVGAPDGATRQVVQVITYKLDAQAFTAGIMGGLVKVVAPYPFRRGNDIDNADTFKIDGHVSFFFTSGDMRFRTDNDADVLHFTGTGEVGGKLGPATINVSGGAIENGVLHTQLSAENFTPSATISDESQTVKKVYELNAEGAQKIYDALDAVPFLQVVKQWTQTRSQDPNTGAITYSPASAGDNAIVLTGVDGSKTYCGLLPLKRNGEVDNSFSTVAGITAGNSIRLRMAIWLRVKNGDGKTVDLVPACLGDDKTFLGVDNYSSMGPAGCDDLGATYPLMLFNGPQITFSVAGLDGLATSPESVTFTPKTVMCPDPRWNWAPEHWYASDSALTSSSWLDEVKTFRRADQGRDQDVFMAASDAGYLQSIYELAFLPRVTKKRNEDRDEWHDHNFDGTNVGEFDAPGDGRTAWATSANDVRNAAFMWRTYNPYDRTTTVEGERDVFESFGVVNEGNGVKVNPYSDDTNVVMAAFANTPFDWWAASTNRTSSYGYISQSDRLNVKEFNKKYAFSAISGNSNAKFAWKDLKRVAQNFIVRLREGLRNDSDFSWEDAYDWLDWSGNISHPGDAAVDYFCTPRSGSSGYDVDQLDSETDNLWGVDRKFLYGYWRECFAPKQQLFLIFVRAEPSMMGGGAVGKTPPALGARAVALVWRDPNPTETDCGVSNQPRPHRTRVLFYRQFE